MKMKILFAALALVIGTGYAVTALSQVKPEVLVKQRQAALTLMGKYFFTQLRPMAQGKLPYDANVVARNVVYLDALTQMPWDGFAPSTANVKSGALPEVYKESAKFKEAQERLRGEIGKLVAAAKDGDEATVKSAILTVNKACGGCHESFREKQ